MKIHLLAASVLLSCAGAGTAFGGVPDKGQSSITLDGGSADVSSAKPRTRKDPNQIICTRSNDHSSRLSRKKVCMTRAQFEERRMLDRDAVERGQANRQTR